MFDFLKKFVGSGPDFSSLVRAVNAREAEMEGLATEKLPEKTAELKRRLEAGETPDDLLPEAFALVRETARRTLGQRHYDVQLWGGIALHRGAIAEMMTGEGKTLAATTAVYLNALVGKGAHVVTVNEYLAKRDAVWMGQIYHALGLSVGCLIHDGALMYDPAHTGEALDSVRDTVGSFKVQEEFLRSVSRREVYEADITYGTNHEFGFDYLRDNLTYGAKGGVQRGHYFAVIDEVDSVLIDEARTPLIISAPDAQSSDYYKQFARVAARLKAGEDYEVDEKLRSVSILESGIDKVENMTGVRDLYAPENMRLVHYLEESLKAHAIFRRDKDYVVKNNEVIIVDQFTGRLMPGRRYSGGLHQAIEAKESVLVKEESRTYAKISIQNYFRLYKKLSGMTGTASTSAEEFHKVYNLDVISIPPHRPVVRLDHADVMYKTRREKYEAIAEEAKEKTQKGQPVLIGTPSIENNEVIATFLSRAGVRHEVLNAKNHEREGAIIAQAGRPGAVTVATNMAGRGVDIVLGGNPGTPEDARKVREAGGLCVFGTERHDARRVDNQLRGRSGRQGDPGESKFFLSLEDDLLRIFGGERLQGMMKTLNVPDNTPIESKFLSKAVSQAQSKVEGFNFDARKHMLEYDDVLNKQRIDFYGKRHRLLGGTGKETLQSFVEEFIFDALHKAVEISEMDKLASAFREAGVLKEGDTLPDVSKIGDEEGRAELTEHLRGVVEARLEEALTESDATRNRLLQVLDMLWMNHLENIEAVQESVRLRAYAQHDPLVEFRRESYLLYKDFFAQFGMWMLSNIFKEQKAHAGAAAPQTIKVAAPPKEHKDIGRNDPCYCGVKHEDGRPKKYKHCHGA